MHEGEEVKQDWEEDKYKAEAKWDRFEDRVDDAPEDAARWTGRKVSPIVFSYSSCILICLVRSAKLKTSPKTLRTTTTVPSTVLRTSGTMPCRMSKTSPRM